MDAPDTSKAANATGNTGKDAADFASQALKAAQAAVSSLKQEAGIGGAGGANAPADAVGAAQAAIDQAKAANGDVGASSRAGAVGNGTAIAGAGASGARGNSPRAFDLPSFGASGGASRPEGIDLLADVNLNVKIELGRTRMLVEDVLRLGEGSVVELDKLAGDPVDVYVNERHVARGEVLVLNDNFCVRINEIVASVGEQAAGR